MKRLLSSATVLALLVGLAGCGSIATVGFMPPDRVLFDRANEAIATERFDVAELSLRTLINTYPESEYAQAAKVLLQDSQFGNYGDVPTPDVMTFFPR